MQLPAHTDISDSGPKKMVPPFKLVASELEQVRKLISEQLIESISTLMGEKADQIMTYLPKQICGGKMLRPGLVSLSYRAVCNGSRKKDDNGSIVWIGAIVEIIHNATLLHDDVLDHGQKRRGQPTVNSLLGNEAAVLVGDLLLSRACRMCAELDPQINKMIADATARTCAGELNQVMQRQNWQLSEEEYLDIITEKSAALFSNSCCLGAFLAQADPDQMRAFSDFGSNMGVAFQITDDLLDISGDESKAGKTLGSDVDSRDLTLAVIHLLQTSDSSRREDLISRISDASCKDNGAMLEMLGSCGSLEYARGRARQFVEQAVAALDDLEDSEAKEALIATAKFAADRVV